MLTDDYDFREKITKECVVDGKLDLEMYEKRLNMLESKNKAIADFVKEMRYRNLDDIEVDMFVRELIIQHRTHQQNIVRNLYNALKKYSETSGTDDRNESSVKWAKKATEEDHYFPFI